MDKTSFFILNIFLNSLLAFFTVALLIEGIVFLFRIKQGRLAAALRMIPILKLPLDLYLYDFSRWSYVHGVNPLQGEEGSRMLSVTLGSMRYITDWLFLPVESSIQLMVSGDMTFTLADLLGYSLEPTFLKIFASLFVFATLCLLIKRFIVYFKTTSELNSLAETSQPSSRKIRNVSLHSMIKKYRFQILTSSSLKGSPFVAGLTSPIVYIPEEISQNLTGKEFEAVLAHEIEHIRCKDSFVRLVLDLIESIFWWVPTKWLHKLIEEGQEIDCDLQCQKYGVNPIDLASAICKSAKYSICTPDPILRHHLTKNTIHKRINSLLNPFSLRFKKIRFAFASLAIGIALTGILLGRFWTF